MAVRKKNTATSETKVKHEVELLNKVSKGYSKKLYPHGLYFISPLTTPHDALVIYNSFPESKEDTGATCYLQEMVDGFPTIVKQKFIAKP